MLREKILNPTWAPIEPREWIVYLKSWRDKKVGRVKEKTLEAYEGINL